MNTFLIGTLILVVAIAMTMVGKGGGNFYIVILTLAQIPMHQAATTGQFILFAASIAAMIIFQKNKVVCWSLALMIGAFTSLSALFGGYFSHCFSVFSLKLLFSVMLVLSGALMLVPTSNKSLALPREGLGFWKFRSGGEVHTVNLWIALPVTLLTGFASGMVGVSGGCFLVPLMILSCGVPMVTAVGTASILIAATSLMGFAGHALRGDFVASLALPLAIVTIVGGILGSRFALKSKPKNLKRLFAYTNWIAAVFMIVNALKS